MRRWARETVGWLIFDRHDARFAPLVLVVWLGVRRKEGKSKCEVGATAKECTSGRGEGALVVVMLCLCYINVVFGCGLMC